MNCLLHPTWIWFLFVDNYESYVFQNKTMYYKYHYVVDIHASLFLTLMAYEYTMENK